jgi:hypothetical protein
MPDRGRHPAGQRTLVPAELSGVDRTLLAVDPPRRYKRPVPEERSVSILVVEDDAAMRDLLTEELSDAGYSVQAGSSSPAPIGST